MGVLDLNIRNFQPRMQTIQSMSQAKRAEDVRAAEVFAGEVNALVEEAQTVPEGSVAQEVVAGPEYVDVGAAL